MRAVTRVGARMDSRHTPPAHAPVTCRTAMKPNRSSRLPPVRERSPWSRVRALGSRAALAVALVALAAPACDAADGPAPAAEAGAAAERAVEAPRLGPKVFPMEMAPALDGPGRDAWQHPDEVVAALRIRAGDRVADVGCGTGYFTLRFVRAVGPTGRVVAVDLQQGMLDLLAGRLGEDDVRVVTLRCNDRDPSRPLEPADALDVVFCANTLHEVDDADAPAFVASMAAGLAPGGRLALLDWAPKPMRLGPPLEHRITPERVRELARGAGLVPSEEIALLATHSFLVFAKPK